MYGMVRRFGHASQRECDSKSLLHFLCETWVDYCLCRVDTVQIVQSNSTHFRYPWGWLLPARVVGASFQLRFSGNFLREASHKPFLCKADHEKDREIHCRYMNLGII
jgi:hypothetical protein